MKTKKLISYIFYSFLLFLFLNYVAPVINKSFKVFYSKVITGKEKYAYCRYCDYCIIEPTSRCYTAAKSIPIESLTGYIMLTEGQRDAYVITAVVTTAIFCIIIIIILWIVINSYFSGAYDPFFNKYTEPKLQALCDFLNRRNGGCKD